MRLVRMLAFMANLRKQHVVEFIPNPHMPLNEQSNQELSDVVMAFTIAKEATDPPLHLMDGVISQERVHTSCQMQHLSKNDAAIEWVAWLLVLGLLFTAIWLAGLL